MRVRAWDHPRHEFFDTSMPGCQWFNVTDGQITASALFNGAGYNCVVQVAHPTITYADRPIFPGDRVHVVTWARYDHLNKNGYTTTNQKREVHGIVVHDTERGIWKVKIEPIEEKIAVAYSTPPIKMPRREWFVIEIKYREYCELSQAGLLDHWVCEDPEEGESE